MGGAASFGKDWFQRYFQVRENADFGEGCGVVGAGEYGVILKIIDMQGLMFRVKHPIFADTRFPVQPEFPLHFDSGIGGGQNFHD